MPIAPHGSSICAPTASTFRERGPLAANASSKDRTRYVPRVTSIDRHVIVDVPPEQAWDALRDFGALHTRLARGFATDCRLEGSDRVVTFANGTILRERLIAIDEERRRVVWTILDGPFTHHNGAAQVSDEGGRTRFEWTTDLLPDELHDGIAAAMERGLAAIKETLESA